MSVLQEGVNYKLTLQDLFTSKIKTATSETNQLNNAVNKTQLSLNSLRGAFATVGAGLFISDMVRTTASMEGLKNQMNFASGSVVQGAKDFEYIKDKANELGIDLLTAASSFAKFQGAARGTSLAGEGARKVFEGVAMASTVMHLTAEQSEGAFRALEQMMSKGKVQAEELRGQLGERIPGAFQIAARAMNMTTMELDKFMSDGKLLAEDFLPKFANQLKLEFAGGVDAAKQSVTANLALMTNAWTEFKFTLGELFLPVIIGVTKAITTVANVLKSTVEFVKENQIAFAALAAAIGTAATAMFVYSTYVKAAAFFSTIKLVWGLAAALEGTTVAQWLLNTATSYFAGLTGVGIFAIAAAGVAAIGVAAYMASQKQEMLNNELKRTQEMGALQSATNPLTNKTGSTPLTTPKAAASPKGGTSTNIVETKGHQNFNIDIGNLIERLEINTTNLKDSAASIKEEVTKALIQAVNDFQLMATK